MPQAYNLTTKEKVKALLGITSSDDNALFDSLCDQVSAFIENLCGGQRFKLTTHADEIHDGDDGQWLRLNNRFIYTTTDLKVEYNNGDNVTPDWQEVSANDYDVYLANGTIHLHEKIAGKRNLRVYYEAGFTTIPYDLEMAATNMVARYYNHRKSQGLATEGFEGVNMTWNDTMSADERAIIDNYTRRSFI